VKKDEDGVRSLPAEEEAVEDEKMKMVSSLYLQRKRLVAGEEVGGAGLEDEDEDGFHSSLAEGGW
jgi:hypothetical protein